MRQKPARQVSIQRRTWEPQLWLSKWDSSVKNQWHISEKNQMDLFFLQSGIEWNCFWKAETSNSKEHFVSNSLIRTQPFFPEHKTIWATWISSVFKNTQELYRKKIGPPSWKGVGNRGQFCENKKTIYQNLWGQKVSHTVWNWRGITEYCRTLCETTEMHWTVEQPQMTVADSLRQVIFAWRFCWLLTRA